MSDEGLSLPGLDESGMFFEYYVLSPRENFAERDLHHVLQYFDITFNDDVEPPHLEHFDGKVFKPQKNITVVEFTDILIAMGLRIERPSMVFDRIPEALQDHFDDEGNFAPFDDFTLENLLDLLTKVFQFRLSTTQFNALPMPIRRHFMVFTRDGKTWRYGTRRP